MRYGDYFPCWGREEEILVVGDDNVHRNVASGCIGVGADLVRGVRERLSFCVLHLRNDDLKHYGQAEAFALLADRDLSTNS